MKRDDSLWKSILEDIFDDFLLFFDPQAASVFDFSKDFEYLDKELDQLFPPEDNSYGTRFVDKLVKVHCRNGTDEWILVHIEVQGYHDPHFSRRMFTYYARILDKYDKSITAFAIFTDGKAGFRPCEYYREFMGTSVLYRYNALKIMDQDEEILLNSDNPFAVVMMTVKAALKTKNISEDELFKLKLNITRNLLARKISKLKIQKILMFLRFYIRFEKRETDFKFEKAVNEIMQIKKAMGIEEYILDRTKKEGIAEGEARKTVAVTKNLLEGTSLSVEEIALVLGVTPEFVKKLKGRVKKK